jgi:tetrahydromethanopterin S-methyltransferase subunit D
MDNLIDGITILFSWEILATAICIYGLTHIIKRIIYIYDTELEPFSKTKLCKIILTVLPIAIGIMIAIHPTFLPGNSFTSRIIAGIVSGFLSNYFYQFVKRVFQKRY